MILEDGSAAVGDCAAVQYSGAGGRDPLFLADQFIAMLERHIRPLLEGRDALAFVANAHFFDTLVVEGKPLHTALRYGLSQALLDAAAQARRCLKVEVLCVDYQLPLLPEPLPLFGQSGDDRYHGVDKMILKQVDVLPHGLFNHVADKLGHRGEKLSDYIRWLAGRIKHLKTHRDYQPDLHIDVYGTIGEIFDHNPERIADYLAQLETAAGGLKLFIEGPVDAGCRHAQIDALAALRHSLHRKGCAVKLVADEWCNTLEDVMAFAQAGCCHMVQIKTPDLGSVHNTLEAVLYCQQAGTQSYQGGSCNETDMSARCCVHVALAARPERLLVKPGMGFDEGMTIVGNEMHRTIEQLQYQRAMASTSAGHHPQTLSALEATANE